MLEWFHPYRPYRQYFGRMRRARLVLRFAIRFGQHYYLRPCRKNLGDLTAQEQERSPYNALYDAMFSLILSGYKRLAKHELREDSAKLLFYVRRWMRQIDDEFERILASKDTPDLDRIQQATEVTFCRERALGFAEKTGSAEAIATTVDSFLTSHFARYLQTIDGAMEAADVAQALEMVRLDSGIWLQTVMGCVRQFNRLPVNPRVDRNLLHVGIAGTLADDLLDVGFDYRDGDSNVLVSILKNEPGEFETMLAAGPAVGALGARWWEENCPVSFQRMFALIEYHHCQIESPHLMATTDLMLYPVMLGYDYKAQIRKQNQP